MRVSNLHAVATHSRLMESRGSWAISLYSASTGSWSYQGCTQDSGNRLMPFESDDAASMTIAKCLNTCQSRGYVYGGVENGYQCFCGSSLNSPTKISEAQCSSRCPGGGNGCG